MIGANLEKKMMSWRYIIYNYRSEGKRERGRGIKRERGREREIKRFWEENVYGCNILSTSTNAFGWFK